MAPHIDRPGIRTGDHMTLEDWNTLVDYYMSDHSLRRSRANTENRSKQPYPSIHGTKAYVEIRDETVVYFFSKSIIYMCLIIIYFIYLFICLQHQ